MMKSARKNMAISSAAAADSSSTDQPIKIRRTANPHASVQKTSTSGKENMTGRPASIPAVPATGKGKSKGKSAAKGVLSQTQAPDPNVPSAAANSAANVPPTQQIPVVSSTTANVTPTPATSAASATAAAAEKPKKFTLSEGPRYILNIYYIVHSIYYVVT